jgi:hypothetical protein
MEIPTFGGEGYPPKPILAPVLNWDWKGFGGEGYPPKPILAPVLNWDCEDLEGERIFVYLKWF